MFKGIIFYIKFFVENFFKDRDSLKFTGGLDKGGGLDSVEYGNSEKDETQNRALIDQQMKYLLGQVSQTQFLEILKERIKKKKIELKTKMYDNFIKVKRAKEIKEEVRKADEILTIEPPPKMNKNYFPNLK